MTSNKIMCRWNELIPICIFFVVEIFMSSNKNKNVSLDEKKNFFWIESVQKD